MKEREWIVRVGEKIIAHVYAALDWTQEQVRMYLVYTLGYDDAIYLSLTN